MQQVNSLLEQTPAFAQVSGRFRFEDELNLLRDVFYARDLESERHPLARSHRIDCEGNRLGRIRNARRNIRIVEWIVEGVTKEHERAAAMMMPAHKTDATKSETVTEAGPVRPVIRIWIGRVIYINPGFGWTTAHIT